MSIIQSLFIGGFQGITEFLPISSSAHLVLIPYILSWQYQGLKLDVALHFGTALAILFYFRKDWILILKNGFSSRRASNDKDEAEYQYPPSLLWQILVASIPAAIVGLLIENKIETIFHSPLLIAINLAVFGLILWLTDKLARSSLKLGSVKLGQSLLIGLSQCLALVPGVSRSGITMVASRGIGLKRDEAARFSFLLGTPAMIGAFLLEARKMTANDLTLPFLIGVAASLITGILAIKFLLNYLKKSNFSIFVWYRLALAILVLVFYSSRL